MIYPTLTLLGELGYVAVSPGEGTSKLHESTEAGRAFLTATVPPWMPCSSAWRRQAKHEAAVQSRGSRGRWKT